ncbi:family 10 glycosylhydrolase [Streptomyces sp. A7024]|uniref:Family 10 glycosylhydrolase n=1 Tax=Streptomyces coryli TaxID=1128680 RepID=A0A6G4UCI4_9ACTN|nr:family 10 glycosylhydrolase [Streptomyces coryli]NGN69722.1 family 10 glycosylhydrolase [Streptomyces coryli]
MEAENPGNRTYGLGRRGLIAAAAGLVASVAAGGEAVAAAPRRDGHGGDLPVQMRGSWVATVANIDWPVKKGLTAAEQKAGLIARLDEAKARNLNTVIFQARPTADAMWPSKYEPWSEWLSGVQGQDPGWDPLGFAVREAHRRGLELHAWFNPYRVRNDADASKLIPSHPAKLHPEWIVPYGGKIYYNPGIPEVRRFVQDCMLDAVRKYDIDAVHFDDYFYPYPVAGQEFADDETYAQYGAGFPDKASWRRNNIDLLILELGRRIKKIKPRVQFGVSPFAVWRNKATDPIGSDTTAGAQTYDSLFADTRKWVKEGWLDYIAPQVYWNIGFAAADYAKLVPWWNDVCAGTGVNLYIGEALYKVGTAGQPPAWFDPAELSRHLTFCKDYPEVKGNIYFSAKQLPLDPLGAVSRLVADHYQQPARPPRC